MIKIEEARKSFNTLVGGEELKEIIEYPPNGNWHKLYLDVERYITQQEKVNELLDLYKDLYNSLSGYDLDDIVIELTYKIKTLESELK